MADNEPFLSRWSRRKLEARDALAESAPPAEPPAAAADAPAASAAGPAEVESPQAMTPAYREYFDPRVKEDLRRAALKQLFNDPHFNVMDGLDTYIDDYSKPDPIPNEMLRRMNQAKELFLFDEEKNAAGNAAGSAAPDEVAATEPPPVAAAEAPALPAQSAAAGDDALTGEVTGAGSAVSAEKRRND